ncbi:CHRD domain-containing protein [Alkalicoccus halolimnae]|uniref:CHRD domain-containing protein n=1 Tax=Alkalicoccus halolimnae TaxID=1667239 RepID=A0A5C7FAP7_9BACI|nr:CHRD domain-containing protein [Alkalicoccus halolimnae]TXF83300.1 CHRD domain-containing protein [Alkalicoccus halolimnae]
MKKGLVLSTASLVAFAGFAGTASAAHGTSYMAELTPDQEVEEVDSDASGHAEFHVSDDGESIDFIVEAHELNATLAGHLHSGPAGENGPVELFLFENDEAVDYDGEIASGTLTEDDLAGEMGWEEFSEELVNGNIYANLHTETYPDGEIRGQLDRTDGDGEAAEEEEADEGEEMADTASNGPLYTMIGMFAALAGGLLMIGRRNKTTA